MQQKTQMLLEKTENKIKILENRSSIKIIKTHKIVYFSSQIILINFISSFYFKNKIIYFYFLLLKTFQVLLCTKRKKNALKTEKALQMIKLKLNKT